MKNSALPDDPNGYPFNLDGPITKICPIKVERYIGCTENCNPLDMTVDREPDFIHPSEHVCEANNGKGIEGGSDSDNYRSDSWYVDRQFYRLTTMRVWKDAQAISGLEVKYVPPQGYKGWPDYIKMYGYEHLQPANVEPT